MPVLPLSNPFQLNPGCELIRTFTTEEKSNPLKRTGFRMGELKDGDKQGNHQEDRTVRHEMIISKWCYSEMAGEQIFENFLKSKS